MATSSMAKCIIKTGMKLVTFRIGRRPPASGVLADEGRSIVPLERSVLEIVEGG
jgi:hypothetical protein